MSSDTNATPMNVDDAALQQQHQQQQQPHQLGGGVATHSSPAPPPPPYGYAGVPGTAPPNAAPPQYYAFPQYPPQFDPRMVAATTYPSRAVPSYMGAPPPSHHAYATPAPSVSMPQGYPPLMPLASMQRASSPIRWSCPDPERMVMCHHQDPRCPTCTTYWSHYEAALVDPQFVQAHEEARARQQAAYYDYFNRARGEGSREDVSRLRQVQDDLRRSQENERDLQERLLEARRTGDHWRTEAETARTENQNLRGRLSRLQREADELRARNRLANRDRSRSPRPRARDEPSSRPRSPLRPEPPRGDNRRPSPSSSRPRAIPQGGPSMPPPSHSGPSRRARRADERDRGSSQRPHSPQVRLPTTQAEFVQGSSRPASSGPPPQPRSTISSNASTPAAAGPLSLLEPAVTKLPGPEIVDFENDSEDEFVLSEEDGIDMKKVLQMQARHTMRRNRNKDPKKPVVNAPPRERLTPLPGQEQPTPDPLPPSVPQSTVEWPAKLPAVRPTDVRLADSWYNYVPVHSRQAQHIMREARDQMAGALHRIKHLIRQIDEYPGYMGIAGMALLKRNWKTPRSVPDASAQSSAPVPVAPAIQEGTDRTSMRQPTHEDPPEVWQAFYRIHPRSIPLALRLDPDHPDAIPSASNIRANLLLRRFMPNLRRDRSSARAALLDAIVRVFSVHGLYDRIRAAGGYPMGPVENIRPFPSELHVENISDHDVARWAARCGVSHDTVVLLEHVARFYRNHQLDRPLNSVEPWPTAPRSIEDVGRVPSEAELPFLPYPSDSAANDGPDVPDAMLTDVGAPAAEPIPTEEPNLLDITMQDVEGASALADGSTGGGSVLSTTAPPEE
ncbi:hypothetical protein K466DRAFT_605498 [Polyporus arcularius HHB13444]|uniref:Uncharacterized protein n=1 Tax=Polyporus arcularius HHB13444 TaxID=1314778 RepID=A0A5C3NSK4_9APHY|nr:hypothetical protein K466DRAFT_605498 [Polyporus arcularius HHB13444]